MCVSDENRLERGGRVAAGVRGMIDQSAASPSTQRYSREVPETLPKLSHPDTSPAVWAVLNGWHCCLGRHRRAGRRSKRSTPSTWNAISSGVSLAIGTRRTGGTRAHLVNSRRLKGEDADREGAGRRWRGGEQVRVSSGMTEPGDGRNAEVAREGVR